MTPERFLELNDLSAHGGLLNAVGHVSDTLANPPVPGDVIKELQVMNIHIDLIDARPTFID